MKLFIQIQCCLFCKQNKYNSLFVTVLPALINSFLSMPVLMM